MTDARHVGFIGLGTMGMPMARSLLRAGWGVSAFDVSETAMAAAATAGATTVTNAAQVAATCDVVMIAVFSEDQVRETVLGPEGLRGRLQPGSVVVVHSTVHPDLCRELDAVLQPDDVRLIDAPMTGGPGVAESGHLTLMIGGDSVAVGRATPALAAVSAGQHHLGPVGAGLSAKIAVNLAIAVNMVGVHEALILSGALGVDEDAMRDLLAAGSADSWVARNWRVIGGTAQHYPHGAAGLTAMAMKDLSLALSLAQRCEVALPGAALSTQLASSAYDAAYQSSLRGLDRPDHHAGRCGRRSG
jgi:3-hydroxyisobutyrate dehydrogenase-like beta-hydroxyacid dehydrogenase